MKKVVFIVDESQDGGFYAKSVDHSIVTQGESLPELKSMIDDAVCCHFGEKKQSKLKHS